MSRESLVRKAGRLAGLLARLAVRGPGGLRHVLGTALDAAERISDPETDIRQLPEVQFDQLAPGENTRIATVFFPRVPASVSPLEALALGLLLRKLDARRVFEFGTYKGVSTTQLALNLAEGGQIFTLDLPEDDPRYELAIAKAGERAIAAEAGKGGHIPADLRPAITFLREDSAGFNPAPYAESIDLVFVDGAHSADYVRNDSEKGWAMLRPGGIIVWHDCFPNHPDVVRYVRGCGWAARRIADTSLAIATKPASA